MRRAQIKAFFIVLIFVFSNAETLHFSSDSFTESAEHIINPDQGFYNPVIIYCTPTPFTHEEINPEQIYHLNFDISAFSAVNNGKQDLLLTDNVLNGIENYLSEIKKANKNAIISFSYDPDFDGNPDREASMLMIKRHIEQISPKLQTYIDTIIAVEAGMIGRWGEMNGSKMATDENKAKVFKYWLDNLKGIPILARTPTAIFTYFGKTLEEMEKYKIDPSHDGYRLGLHNDCYLSSNSDQGTYQDRPRETKWLSTQNEHLPYGGETCAVHERSDLENAIPEMRLLKLSYLNIEYNQNVSYKWGNLTYKSSYGSDKIFYGMNGFEYIKRHFGYRLFIKSISVDYEEYGSYNLKIKLGNAGFGNLLKTKKLDIIFTDMNDKQITRRNVGEYKGSLDVSIYGKFLSKEETSEYKVYLSVYGSIENNVIY